MLNNNRFINSKLKARISLMLSDSYFLRLIRSHTLQEAVQLLRGTEYDVVNSSYTTTGDLKMGELGLFAREVEFYREFEPFYPKYLKLFVYALLTKYEIDVLKSALRLWFDKNLRGRSVNDRTGYIYRKTILNEIPVDEIINASSLEQIAHVLSETPYYNTLLGEIENVGKYKSLFLLETALDIDYFKGIFESIESLRTKDRKLARDYFSFIVDIENIKWADRFKGFEFYKEIDSSNLFIPGGKILTERLFQNLLLHSDKEFLNIILPYFPSVDITFTGRHMVDNLIGQLELLLKRKINRMLRGDPFSVGILIAYFTLKQEEISKLIMILNAISYGLPEQRIKALL